MAPPSPPSLQQALSASTAAWQTQLQALFEHAKDRFPDVVWDLQDEDGNATAVEEVWGHKAIVYARAPPSFQARYFSFRPAPIASPAPYAASPVPAQSALSLSLGLDYPSRSPSPSPRASSPAPSMGAGGVLRIATTLNPALFENELEYLYTGKGFGAAFEFLFDTSESRELADTEEARVDKLRKDLVFMWRSRLYSDVRIALSGAFSSQNHDPATAIFSSHRFMLITRSPYFLAQLVTWGLPAPKPGEPLTLTLPSPPFTPASLHFTLGFIYTGTLVFSHRSYDLDTAFAIMRSATYLSLDSLYDEIQARIAQEMLHGLYHAFLEFSEYERITGGRWGVGGCRCRQCARRAPRVLEFAVADDVKNEFLERGARRALVGLFGEGWCNAEFTLLPQRTRDGLLKGLAKRTTPPNVFALLFAAEHALDRIGTVIDAWADISREMLLSARKTIDYTLCAQAEECFEQPDWLEIMQDDGARFEDAERVTWTMDAIRRGLTEKSAPMVYQVLVSSILLRPHATETEQTMLAPTSNIRGQVEQARVDVLRWLRKRWIGARQEGGFDALESWALKEISHEIEVPVDDLIQANAPSPAKSPVPKTSLRVANRADDGDSVSVHSLRPRGAPRHNGSAVTREPLHSSGASIRSVARSTYSTASRATAATTATTPRRKLQPPPGPRPDSKLTPSASASDMRSSIATSEAVTSLSHSIVSSSVSTPSRRPKLPSLTTPTTPSSAERSPRPKSLAPSVTSVKSHASTVRKSVAGANAGPSTLRPPPDHSRPSSTLSTTSDGSTAYKSAKSELTAPSSGAGARTRRLSAASTMSNASARSTKAKSPATLSTPRLPSTTTARRASPASIAASVSSASTRTKRPSAGLTDTARQSLTVKRSPSAASTRSTASTTASISASRKSTPRKSVADAPPMPTPGSSRRTAGARLLSTASTTSMASAKSAVSTTASRSRDKGKARPIETTPSESGESTSRASSETTSTFRDERSLKRKSSADTIKESTVIGVAPALRTSTSSGAAPPPSGALDAGPRGATLDIGIPCIISSKRAKFRAFARYIGEIAGERGPWVGVEVPVRDDWAADKLEGRQWHDGTWGGIRYFDLGASSEWDMGDDPRGGGGGAGSRRRPMFGGGTGKGLKREGDQLYVDRAKRFRSASPAVSEASNTESRGLFVRPSAVLYVVDAVGSDL